METLTLIRKIDMNCRLCMQPTKYLFDFKGKSYCHKCYCRLLH